MTDIADSSDSSVVEEPPEAVGQRPRRSRVQVVLAVAMVLTVVAAITLALWPSGYLIDAPGNAISTDSLVEIPATVKTYSHPGDFRLVTVSETANPLFGQAFVAWLAPDSDVFPRSEVVGDTPRADELRFEAVLMQGAQLSAIYKALRYVGQPAVMTGGGAFVNQIVPRSAADGVLSIGDTITSMNGDSITTVDDVTRFMKTAEIGEKVSIVVDRMGVSTHKRLNVTLGSAIRDGKRVPQLGIYMETRANYQFPFTVRFDTGDIGGPSAGLAMTLTLIDKLSKQGLTRGNDIAVTGTIQADGTVGTIGGIRQKVATVRRAGVHYFLVPVGNAVDACAATGDPYGAKTAAAVNAGKVAAPKSCGDAKTGVRIIPVASLDGALGAVRRLPVSTTH